MRMNTKTMEIADLRERTIFDADQNGYRLEFVGGLGVWEASPVLKHQRAVLRIQNSIRPAVTAESGCGCVHYADLQVRFADGSLKRPDIAVFCREPDEQDAAVTLQPEAVIEILSRGYEAKDLEIGVPFYRRMHVKDIIVLDPDTDAVLHWAGQLPACELTSPVEITLQCGCRCTV
jgi:Uma2 family endonuclease